MLVSVIIFDLQFCAVQRYHLVEVRQKTLALDSGTALSDIFVLCTYNVEHITIHMFMFKWKCNAYLHTWNFAFCLLMDHLISGEHDDADCQYWHFSQFLHLNVNILPTHGTVLSRQTPCKMKYCYLWKHITHNTAAPQPSPTHVHCVECRAAKDPSDHWESPY